MELEAEIDRWVEYYNNKRYYEAVGNITPRDKYLGKEHQILARRRKIKEKTLNQRRKANRNQEKRLAEQTLCRYRECRCVA